MNSYTCLASSTTIGFNELFFGVEILIVLSAKIL
jgi:hypothetical protein